MGGPIGKNGRFIKKGEAKRRMAASEAMKLRNIAKARKEERKPVYEIGKRVVDIGILAKSMWCDFCDLPLSFRNLEEERQQGLASVFQIRCYKCLMLISVNTSNKV